MKLTITESATLENRECIEVWNTILRQRDYYSYFQTQEWSNFLVSLFPHAKIEHRWFRFSDGVEAIFLLIAMPKKWGLYKLESLPWGTYGGLLSTRPLDENHIKTAMKHVVSLRKPLCEMNLSPSDSEIYGQNTEAGKSNIVSTHCLTMREDFSEIWKNQIQARTRTAIRKGKDSGVKVYWSNHADSIKHFHELYKQCCQQWENVEILPDAFFTKLKEKPLKGMRLWIAYKEKSLLAADLMFYGKGEVQYFAGANDPRFSQWNGSKVLMAKIIQDACERGFRQFNFGASAGLPGVEQFKRHFGGVKTPYYRVQKRIFYSS